MGSTYVRDETTTGFHNNTKLNANLQDIQTALERSLSRYGDSPNEMNALLDMNSNRILNLPTPTSVKEPVTIEYLNSLTPPPAVANVGNPMPLDLDMDGYRVTNAGDPLIGSDYVTLDYFDANHSGATAVALLDADTLDTHDSAADPLVPVADEIPYWDSNGDIGVRRLHLTDTITAATATHVGVVNSSNGQLRLMTFSQFKSQLGGTAIEFTTTTPQALSTFIGSSQTVAHSLGEIPAVVQAHAICTTAEHGFSIGDHIPLALDYEETGGGSQVEWGIKVDDTNVTAYATTNISVIRPDTGAFVTLTGASWDVQFMLVGTV